MSPAVPVCVVRYGPADEPDERVVARLAERMREAAPADPCRWLVERLRVQVDITSPGDDDLRELVVDLLAALDRVEGRRPGDAA